MYIYIYIYIYHSCSAQLRSNACLSGQTRAAAPRPGVRRGGEQNNLSLSLCLSVSLLSLSIYLYTYIARVRHMNDTGTTYCLDVAFWVQVPVPRMGAGWCCRRCSSVASAEDSEDSWRSQAAPSCPQEASPGGTVWQLSPATGLLRRRAPTPLDSQWDRFGSTG